MTATLSRFSRGNEGIGKCTKEANLIVHTAVGQDSSPVRSQRPHNR
jgi:hypothetical protein